MEGGGRDRRGLSALKVVSIYVVFGALWILFSDRLLFALIGGDGATLTRLQTFKGWFFIAVTATLLYVLVRRAIAEAAWILPSLRRSEDNLNRAQRVAHLGSWFLDLRTDQLDWSDETYRIFQIDKAERLSFEHFVVAVHPDERERVAAAWRDALAGEPYDIEHRIVVGGDVRWVRERAEIRFDPTGAPVEALGTVQDVTERRRLEEALKALNDGLEQRVTERTLELEAANQELKSFSYSVSHDLKAPLRGIDGYSQILLEEYGDRLDEEARHLLGNIRRGVGQMHELIEDLLAYSRMERHAAVTDTLDLHALAVSVAAACRRDGEAGEPEIEVGLPAMQVAADRDGLALVLRNLIENALKFTRGRDGARVEVDGRVENHALRLWVRDNGIGFDMKYHDRIFDIFQRLHRVEDYPGTGIGLALVKKAVTRMGGRVWAQSAPGEGATFFVELPQ